MKIPAQNKWTHTNNGYLLGSVHETHNMNFDRQGEVRLTKKAMAMIDSSTSGFENVLGIRYFNGGYHIVTLGGIHRGSLSGSSFTTIASTPTLFEGSDSLVFNSKLYVTTATSLSSLNTSVVWANSLDTYTTGYPHPMAEFASMTTYKLAVGNKNQVETLDTSHNANATVLTIPSNYVITCLEYRSGYLYIGTKEIYGGEAMIFIWNGTGANAQYSVPTGAQWVYSMVPYKAAVAFVTNEGELLYVNGTSTEQLAAFPVFYTQGARWEQGDNMLGKVYPRGMTTIGSNIYINISGEIEVGNVPEMRSGVWCFDPSVGLYHYASSSTDLWTKDSSLSVTDSVITTTATHNIKLGDAVVFTSVSGLSGIENNKLYYAIPVAAATLKLAGCLEDANSGEFIVLSGTPTTDTLHYAANVDNGNTFDASSGAIVSTNYLDDSLELFGSDLMWGTATVDNTDTIKKALCVLSPKFNEGSFTTQRILTENVTQTWKKVFTFLTGLLNENETAIVKYIARERPIRRPVAIIWSDTNTFVTTDPFVRYQIEAGDEVSFIAGNGQGRCAHVVAVDDSTATVEITIDDTFGTNASTAHVRFSGFKKVATVTGNRVTEDYVHGTVDAKSTWVQIKVELRGFEPAVTMIELTNSVDKSAV